ncbi:MAG: ABC transporter ATP-binding protein [Erysipelotrichaceae bacterium]|jgi:ABC-2 type transport system ATP-binding protein|nr:ABC transporter ATP-binding protein [Erysipelotrichaceae bacterium]MCI1327035.1 ABC transporter ATP-binding protein [Solobacterium sp.]MCH4045270.1 ABC transporter ATP-binding protein [Erysipelotrichaceae bacterium]MCH4122480.1 ABC transporter ATP-binding protein [Erysipelotrichaceae bacterium]MCI1363747.1 ABC transporter ATP-binding protein [Solobacterium sp.]
MTRINVVNYSKIIKGRVILEDVNLSLESGRIYGLKGVNGSGKTMLLRALCGLIYPTSGYVEVDGEKLRKNISFPRSVGALIESPAFLDNFTGYKNLEMIASLKEIASRQDIEDALTEVGLDPHDARTYKKYSLGMKQKLGLACCFMEKPDIILLDEPFNALDEESVEKIKKIMIRHKERGALIVLACHDGQSLLSLSDEIYNVVEGRVTKADKDTFGQD